VTKDTAVAPDISLEYGGDLLHAPPVGRREYQGHRCPECLDLTDYLALVIVTYAFMSTLIQNTGRTMTMTTMAMRITELLEEGAG